MALPFVQDILAAWPGVAVADLSYGDEISGQGSGRTIVKNLRDPLWTLHAESRYLEINEIRFWRAKLAGLDNGQGVFLGYDMVSRYPAAYPNGTWPTGNAFSGATAQISAIGGDGKSIRVKGLPSGFIFTVGDLLQVTHGTGSPPTLLQLLMVEEPAIADGAGLTGTFEVRPAIPATVAIDCAVSVKQPACHMMIVPGSVSLPKNLGVRGVISFDAIQVPQP